MASGPIETKVTAGTTGAVLSAAALWALDEYVFRANDVPAPISALVTLLVVGVVTYLAGFSARHTARPDLGQN